MQTIVPFNVARFLYKIGYKEQTDFLYLNTETGIRAVISDAGGKQVGEKIFYEGALEKVDETYGIVFPSSHWIPAPLVFDAIKFIEDKYNIRLSIFYDNGYIYSFIVPEELQFKESIDKHYNTDTKPLDYSPTKSHTIEVCFDNALRDFMKMVKEEQIKIDIV